MDRQPTIRVRRPRASASIRVLASLVFLLLFLQGFMAEAADASELLPKNLVLHVEAEGGLDAASVRVLLRKAVPANFIILDAEQFREALNSKGERGPISKRLHNASTRDVVIEHVRAAAHVLRADGVIIATAKGTPRARQSRLEVRLFFVDALDRSTKDGAPVEMPPPVTHDAVIVLPKRIKLDADAARLRDSIGPALDRFGKIVVPGSTPPPGPQYNPLKPPTPPPPPPPPPQVIPVPAAPTSTPMSASIVVRVFPVAGLYSSGTATVKIPLAPNVFIEPYVGAAYLAPKDEGKTDLPPYAGFGFRYIVSPNVWVAPSLDYAPDFLYAGNIAAGAKLTPALRLNGIVSASRYTLKAFDGRPLFVGQVWIDVPTRPFKWLSFTPHFSYFVYGRDLTEAKKRLTGLAVGLAPYPIQAMVGIRVGYETGRLSPYVASRHYFYDANSGYANTLGVGLKLTQANDYVDARIGAIFSNGKGPFANAQLEVVPVINVEAGWNF